MNKKILKLAKIKFKELSKKYDGFINVIVDDWRGYRFIFDTTDVRKCKNKCDECKLYNLLKNEREGLFSSGLFKASKVDKEIFGKQNYLNCKTLEQYQQCYINFIKKKITTFDELSDEIKLIKNLKIIYSKNNNVDEIENNFKNQILKNILKCK